MGWMAGFIPSMTPLVDLRENQLRIPPRSSRTVAATLFIRGTLECATQPGHRSSPRAADSPPGMGQAARSASAIARARAASGRSDMSDAFLAARRPVRSPGLFSQRYLVPLGSRPPSADDFASARLTRSASRGASRMTWRRSTAWEALGVAPAHPGEHGAAMSRATSETAGASPPCASSWAQGLAGAPRPRPSASRRREAAAEAVAPDMTAAIARASKGAARCELGRTSQGARTVRAPCPGQPARGTAQRTIVPCRQTPRWRQARPRESRAPRGAPHTGRGTAAPRLRATPRVQLVGAPVRLEPGVGDLPGVAGAHRPLEGPGRHPRLGVRVGTSRRAGPRADIVPLAGLGPIRPGVC